MSTYCPPPSGAALQTQPFSGQFSSGPSSHRPTAPHLSDPAGRVMGSVRSAYACFRLPISGVPFSLNLLSRNSSLGCSLRCVHEASDCLLYSCHSRGNGEASDWKANGTGEIAAEKAKVVVRAETARNLPPRTTGCVPGNEQCVCHWGSKSRASRRATYELGCRADGLEIWRETIMKRRAPVLDGDALTAEIAALAKASIKDLRQRWKTLYGKEPSGHIGRSFVIQAIAYRLQEKAFGGLKPSTRRLLARVAEEAAAGSSPKRPPVRKAEMGTILIRQWQGKTHRVTVLGDGSVLQGQALPFALRDRA